ncbi:MAG: hypothetical protein WD875_03890 [Pirellulales bacterium]
MAQCREAVEERSRIAKVSRQRASRFRGSRKDKRSATIQHARAADAAPRIRRSHHPTILTQACGEEAGDQRIDG